MMVHITKTDALLQAATGLPVGESPEEVRAAAERVAAIEKKEQRRKRPAGGDGESGPFQRVVSACESHPVLSKVRFDIIAGKPVLADGGDVTGKLIADLRLQAERPKAAVSKDLALDAIEWVAHKDEFDALTEMLEQLEPWDNVGRLSNWLITYCGAEDNPTNQRVGRMSLIAAMARAFSPGCQCKYVLDLQGPQDIGKSKALQILATDRFFLSMTGKTIGSRDTKVELHGKWIAEFSDLGTLPKTEANVIKAFISDAVDNVTLKYARSAIDIPRRSIFVVTENPDGAGWSTDSTGNVRFWPVSVTKIDHAKLKGDREQLLAEALAAYRSGENWWPDGIATAEIRAELAERQDGLRSPDPWEAALMQDGIKAQWHRELKQKEKWNQPLDFETSTEWCLSALNVEIARRTRSDEMRVAKILKSLGFRRVQTPSPVDEKRPWRYVR